MEAAMAAAITAAMGFKVEPGAEPMEITIGATMLIAALLEMKLVMNTMNTTTTKRGIKGEVLFNRFIRLMLLQLYQVLQCKEND